jgi:hypothetical protein
MIGKHGFLCFPHYLKQLLEELENHGLKHHSLIANRLVISANEFQIQKQLKWSQCTLIDVKEEKLSTIRESISFFRKVLFLFYLSIFIIFYFFLFNVLTFRNKEIGLVLNVNWMVFVEELK